MKVAVGVATAGRSELVSAMLRFIERQTRKPDRVVVCSPVDAPAPDIPDIALVIRSPRGLPAQRNAILDAVADADVVVFFDDDFVADRRYLEVVAEVHESHPDVVMTTGTVVADGIGGTGLTTERAAEILAARRDARESPKLVEVHNGYGCNMSVRLDVARAHHVRFDTRLPLYAWQEDVDFSRRMARFGRLVRVDTALGVHLGVTSGRQSGLRLGYSQVANPIYLLRKGSCRADRVALQVGRNVLANLAKVVRPEAHIDRAGRLRGNWLALRDVCAGRVTPERILDL